jgi:alpha-L-fucosidase
LYAIQMAWPENGRALIHALGAGHEGKGLQIKSVELVGGTKVEWRQSDDAMEVILPGAAPGKYAYVLKVTLQ